MTTEGSSTIALLEILGVVSQRLHRGALGVHLALETEHVFELGAAMLADVAERKVTDLHAMYHERTRDAEDAGRVVRAEFLIFGEDCDSVAFEQMAEQRGIASGTDVHEGRDPHGLARSQRRGPRSGRAPTPTRCPHAVSLIASY
jgi:hypothetical protein